MRATFGDLVTPYAIEKMVMGEGEKAIVGIISKTIEIAKIHFIPGIGFLQCFEGQCCADHGLPSVRNGIPIMKYQSDGKLTITSDEMEFMMLQVGNTDYKDLMTKNDILQQQGSDITKKDFLVTCIDAKYQKRKFDVLGDAKWRKVLSQDLYKEKMTLFVNSANTIFGRVVDLPTYQSLMAALTEAPIVDRPSADSLRRNPPSKAVATVKTGPTLVTTPGQSGVVGSATVGDTPVVEVLAEGVKTVDVSDLDFDSLVE